MYKPFQDVVAYDGDTNITFTYIAASIGWVIVTFAIYSTPPGSKLQAGAILSQPHRGIGVLPGPVSVYDNGTTIGIVVEYGPVPPALQTGYNYYTATLFVLGNHYHV